MSKLDAAALEGKCINLTQRYYHLIDRGHFVKAAELFSEKGSFIRGSENILGPQHLIRALGTRPEGQIIRHIVGNVIAEVLSDARVNVLCDLQVYIQKPNETGAAPPMAYMADLIHEFVREEDGCWRMQRIAAAATFRV